MATNKGLGRGFDALVPNTISIQDVANRSEDRVHHLAIDIVKPRSDQPRRTMDEAELEQLRVSIEQHGVLQPIIVMRVDDNMYSIVAGERRWRAAKDAGLAEIPAIVRSLEELQMLEVSILENVQRSDLSPLEVAMAIHRLHHEFNQTYERIAESLGKAYVTIINTQRLLKLPTEIQAALQSQEITEGHARSLLALEKQPEIQLQLFNLIRTRHMSVRQTEAYVRRLKQKDSSQQAKPKLPKTVDTRIASLSKNLALPVEHRPTKRGGSIVIRYKNERELDSLIKRFDA